MPLISSRAKYLDHLGPYTYKRLVDANSHKPFSVEGFTWAIMAYENKAQQVFSKIVTSFYPSLPGENSSPYALKVPFANRFNNLEMANLDSSQYEEYVNQPSNLEGLIEQVETDLNALIKDSTKFANYWPL